METFLTLKVNPEYEKLLPKLSPAEYLALKKSIEKEGQFFSITVNPKGIILDGHNRYRICKELGIPVAYEVKKFDNPLVEKKFVIISNLKRRHLLDYQKVELALPLEEIETELAKQRRLATLKKGDKLPIGSNEHHGELGKARDIVAKTIGVSPTTYFRAKTIAKKGSEKLKTKCRSGITSINYAYKSVRRAERHETPPNLPKGEFDVIYADPPWKYDLPLRGDPDFHYQTMKLEEIYELKVPVAKNAILFLWATNPKLREALKVLKAWGFEYKTNLVWVKDKIGTGYYVRGKHELLLIGKRGEIPPPTEQTRFPSVLEAPRREHSQKPEIIYQIIEKMYPNCKYLELFARNKRINWASWGL